MLSVQSFIIVCVFVTLHVANGAPFAGFDCCTSSFSMLCPKCYGCPYTPQSFDNIQKMLRQQIFGQDHAIDLLSKAFKARSNSHALTIHIAGDNGVGKSYTAKTIAEALFVNPDKSLLYLRGEQYQGNKSCEEYKKRIEREICDQLIKCPNSLIIFDEIELVAPETMTVIPAFMDDSVAIVQCGTKKINTGEATIILISDFGAEGRTDKMSVLEIQKLVERDSLDFWMHSKQTHLIRRIFIIDIVPFLPLKSDQDRAKIARFELNTLTNRKSFQKERIVEVRFGEDVLRYISQQVKLEYPMENGRGVAKWINSHIAPKILEKVEHTHTNEERTPTTQNIVTITISKRKISNQMDDLGLDFSVTILNDGPDEL